MFELIEGLTQDVDFEGLLSVSDRARTEVEGIGDMRKRGADEPDGSAATPSGTEFAWAR